LARQAGLRQRTLSFTQVASVLVWGWWKQPQAGPSALARFAGSLEVTLEKQTVACHLTERTANWLRALLQRVVAQVVCAQAIALPLLQQLGAVLLEDGSTISLPPAWQSVWRGCGGHASSSERQSQTQAALKLTLRGDLLHGQLHGPHLPEGRRHELASLLHQQEMAKGSLWIADLGYWTLTWLQHLSRQGVFFLLRYKPGIVLWLHHERLDLLSVLPQVVGQRLELLVDVGASQLLKGVRLLAERVPAEGVEPRHQRIARSAQTHGKPINPLVWELAHWTLLVTNVPQTMLSFEQVRALLRARWPIELLFKLWKAHGLLAEWSSRQPWAILCEVSAKLIALVVQHWFVLLSWWDDPHHRLSSVAEVVREQLPTLGHGLCGHLPLGRAIRLLVHRVGGGCAIPKRTTRLSTSYRLLSLWESGLT